MTKSRYMKSKRDYFSRHARNAIRHNSLKKTLNFIRCQYELSRKKAKVSSLPYFFKVESSASCHLSCPGCQHGMADHSGDYKPHMFMNIDDFKRIVEPVVDYTFGISLSARGEPMLNPQLEDMIAFCSENNIGTEFPTTLSMKLSRERIEDIVAAGLDHMLVAIDGSTQEIYGKYRVGGSLELALENARTFIDVKRKMGKNTPFMEFKFIIFDHNEHQLEAARELSRSMGFDDFCIEVDEWSKSRNEYKEEISKSNIRKRKACYWPWSCLMIYYNGDVNACCTLATSMGNVLETSIPELWNSERYRQLRAFFRDAYDCGWIPCAKCMEF